MSFSPRVKIFHDFLSNAECDGEREREREREKTYIQIDPAMIAEGRGNFEASSVVGVEGQNEKVSGRSSSGTFLMHHSPFIRRIEARIARVTMLPVENQEAFYLLRYQTGQEYKLHPGLP